MALLEIENVVVALGYSKSSSVFDNKIAAKGYRVLEKISKLTKKDKIEIYERNKNGETIASLAKAFNVNKIVLHYLIRLIRKHGYDIIGNGENKHR